jgi:hypothetical protein
MQAFLNRFREFPEFARLSDALSELHANEQRVVEAESSAFGPDFAAFADTFPEALARRLKGIHSAAADKIAGSRALRPSLVALEARLEALRQFQAEIAQLCALTRASEDTARRAAGAGTAADGSAVTERQIATQIQKANLVAIDDMKGQFLDELATLLRDDATARADACRRFIAPGRSIGEALVTFQGIEDEGIQILREQLEELEAETID